MRRVALGLAAVLAFGGCVRRAPAPAPSPHYVVGAGYQSGGTWFYPREDFHYDATGLATVLPEGRGLTADGEAVDATALTAAHPTLQLPCIARVTNLETGRQLLVRINDRGPAAPSRLIALSYRAAELLAVNGVARVRVQVDEAASSALREQLQGGPRLALAAAPRGAVSAETLAPPPGVQQSARGRSAAPARVADNTAPTAPAAVPDRLPETVQTVPVRPGPLMIEAGSFGRAEYADRIAARLSGIGARVRRVREGRTERYAVLAGPFPTVAAADAALAQARSWGPDARIVVELGE